ncbi:DUF5011 domain-containing protein [Terrisporobacter muris]|uniref:DUF5011 domain-containing protein n=1 Tax=Terrisporobacter muris TaxID=2963284 RepID=A0A9X2S0C6_9FIRM|nr:DUF5011 domain-containing protein [Terrisporobacter muris]MCR1821878.1 DUF5011 domain-containing protein [Terrisporobacter muris]
MNAIKSMNGSTIVFNKMPRIECEDITIKIGENLELFDYLVAYDEDNNILDKDSIIISKTNLDTSKAGNYEIVVEVNDRTNTYRIQHTINVLVKTNDKPIIIGADSIEIPLNKVFDPMYGVIANDTEDGIITNKIIVNGFLNVCKAGSYVLTYLVTDSDNNTTIVEREINVLDIQEENVKVKDIQKEYMKNNEEIDTKETIAEVKQLDTPVSEDTLKIDEINNKEESSEYKEAIENIEDNKKPKKLKKRKKVRKKRKKEKPKKLSRKEKKQLKKEEKQKRKELKEEYKKVDKNILDILPFLEIAEDDTFKTKNGYIDIFQIDTKDLNSLNYNDANRHIFDFSNFLRNYIDDMKIISMTFPVNTQIQQQHILKKIESTDNEIYREFLYKRLDQLIAIEEKRKNREFYLMLFYEDEKTKREREIQLLRLSSSAVKISRLDLDKKLRIIFKLNNQNSKI